MKMRAAVIVALVLTTGGCAGVRQGLGLYQKTADKGVTAGGSRAEGVAPPGSAGSETSPAAAGKRAKSASREPKQVLPPGLGGDKEHRAYTGDVPK